MDSLNLSTRLRFSESQSPKNDRMNIIIESKGNEEDDSKSILKDFQKKVLKLKRHHKIMNTLSSDKVLACSKTDIITPGIGKFALHKNKQKVKYDISALEAVQKSIREKKLTHSKTAMSDRPIS